MEPITGQTQREPQIVSAKSELLESINILRNVTNSLLKRLEPILRNREPKPEGKTEIAKKILCSLAEDINGARDQIIDIRLDLEETIKLLEI